MDARSSSRGIVRIRGVAHRRGAAADVVMLASLLVLIGGFVTSVQATFAAFESGPVRPLALSPDGQRLFVANTPDARLEIFSVGDDGLTPESSVPVGLEPVAVAARTNGEVWVVNHLSDSISIVDVAASPPRVTRTLLVGDEPRDIVFAGPGRAFVTTAHRGQHRAGDPQLTTPGVGRADVWVFDAANPGAAFGGTPLSIVTLFTDTPRALAATPDGTRVHVAGFHTGNRTTAIHEGLVCDGGAAAPPCTVSGHLMPGGLPGPNTNVDLEPQPEVGLIVQYDGSAWRDPIGRNWNAAVRFSLPDLDVFTLDATGAPPTAITATSGVGTILFDMIVSPTSGKLFVANTEAQNEVRFEGAGSFGGSTVRGHLAEARISIIDPAGGVVHRRLNKHIDYAQVPSPPGVKERSLATPTALAMTADGTTLWVAAFGSSKVGVFDTKALEDDTFIPDPANHVVLSGGGPAGLVLDEARHRLYVLTRFDDAVSVVDTVLRREIAHLPLHNPEPATLIAGRRFLYDASYTSSNGEASCAACHVFGDLDSLGWDLGDPDGSVLENRNPLRPGLLDRSPDFHPMKGPMTTQSLRGLANHGPLHWRGDRTGGLDAASVFPDAGAYDEAAGFARFNAAFVGLLGRDVPLTESEMQAFAAFALQLKYPPNPIRALDGSLTSAQEAGRAFFFAATPSDVSGPCNFCHVLDPAQGLFGTDGHSVVEPQGAFKIPHLRNAYTKVGMFGMPHVPSPLPGFGFNATDHQATGDQVRGFGFTHDGSVDTVYRFLQTRGFNRSGANPGGFAVDPAGDAQRRQVEEFVLAIDTDFAPVVGQQVTATATDDAAVAARIVLLRARATAGDCDLVVTGVLDGDARSWLYDPAAGAFRADRGAEPLQSAEALHAQASMPGQARTYTCVPPGAGLRIGLDRDEDGFLDRDELDAGSDPARASSTPRDFDPIVVVRGRVLALRDDTRPPLRDAARRIRFRSGRPDDLSRAGDPTTAGSNGGAVLTVYNTSGRGEQVTIALPAAGWRRRGTASAFRGYRYTDANRTAGPISAVSVSRHGAVSLTGGGATWSYRLSAPSQGAVAVRLQLGRGDVWCAVFSARPTAKGTADRADHFDGASSDLLPSVCPPLP